MHQHPYNIRKKGCHQNESPPSISTDLSLMISSTFQSQQGGGATASRIRGTSHYDGKKNHHCCSSYWGYSTSLELYDNPWKIKKALTASDLGKLNRLLFGSDMLEKLMVPVLGEDAQRDAETGMGTPVRVWDVDTMSMHHLILKRWASFRNYVLIGKWNRDFVKRRALKEGDEIGLHWDSYKRCFNFSVLKRAIQQLTN